MSYQLVRTFTKWIRVCCKVFLEKLGWQSPSFVLPAKGRAWWSLGSFPRVTFVSRRNSSFPNTSQSLHYLHKQGTKSDNSFSVSFQFCKTSQSYVSFLTTLDDYKLSVVYFCQSFLIISDNIHRFAQFDKFFKGFERCPLLKYWTYLYILLISLTGIVNLCYASPFLFYYRTHLES